jgi:hypothetical protein
MVKGLNYNRWEKVEGKTTTIGIQVVVVEYNGWEEASVYNSMK